MAIEPAMPPRPVILVVDDDEGLGRLIVKTVAREGYDVERVLAGAEALAWLGSHAADLLLLDLKLQDMQAKELIEHLKGAGHSVPYIIITGQGDERVAVDMMKHGALDYLVKDAEFLTFLPTVVRRTFERLEQERRLACTEEALRQEHAFTSAVLNTCGALIVVLDSGGRIIRFNRAAEKVTGRSMEEVVGRSFFELFLWPEDLASMRRVYQRLLDGESYVEHSTALRTRDNHRRMVTWAGAVLPGRNRENSHIVATGIDITEGKRLENEILQVSEREQRRIGQDLHDGLGQHLTGIEFMTEVLANRLAGASSRSKALGDAAIRAAEINQHVRETIAQARQLARGLVPIVLESDGLMAALGQLATNTEQMLRISCVFECDPPVLVPDHGLATHIYRIAQEAISNAVRHGKARHIVLQLSSVESRTSLIVKDDGSGVPASALAGGGRGMGLRIMQYRAGMIGGSLLVQPDPAGGTLVTCIVHAPGEAAG
jgi:PAS domain S-box-containing protein